MACERVENEKRGEEERLKKKALFTNHWERRGGEECERYSGGGVYSPSVHANK